MDSHLYVPLEILSAILIASEDGQVARMRLQKLPQGCVETKNCLEPLEHQQQRQQMYVFPLRGDGCLFTISSITKSAKKSLGMKKVFSKSDGGCHLLP